MSLKIELIENEEIVTYQLRFNESEIAYLKNELKRLGQEKNINISYDYYIEDIETATRRKKHIDEFLGIVENGFLLKNVRPTSKYRRNNWIAKTTKTVKVKKYPILYHILFGRYQFTNENIINVLNLYLSNRYGLKDEQGIVLYQDLQRAQNIKEVEPYINYDSYLSQDKKIELVKELLDSITLIPIKIEPVQELNKQIDYISKINIPSKDMLIQEVKNRLLIAKQNTEDLNSISNLLDKRIRILKKNGE